MKKVFMVAVATILIHTGFAQVNQGQWLVGGSASFSSSKNGDYKTSLIEFAPDAGYFFIDNFAGGLRFSVQSAKEELGSMEGKASSTTIAPFVRYYFLPAAQKVNVFADASYGFGSVKGEEGPSVSVSGFSFMAGPAIFLSPNTALEVTLGYSSTKMEEAQDRTNTFRFGVGFQIHLGNGSSAK
jgi:Outer membrane protein beta-barrel domain